MIEKIAAFLYDYFIGRGEIFVYWLHQYGYAFHCK